MKIHLHYKFILVVLGMFLTQNVSCQGILFWPYRIVKIYDAMHMSDEEMADKVRDLMDYEDSQHVVCDEYNPYTIRLRKITRNMQPDNCIPLNFKVYYDESTVNAFAAPDGSIRVFSALMDMLDDDELYGVISHELGHVVKKHSKDSYIKSVKLSVIDSDPIIRKLIFYRISSSFLEAHYSQEQEMEADDFACKYMMRNGVAPCALVDAFEKMWHYFLENEPDYRDGGILSTHPGFDKRIEVISSTLKHKGVDCY